MSVYGEGDASNQQNKTGRVQHSFLPHYTAPSCMFTCL